MGLRGPPTRWDFGGREGGDSTVRAGEEQGGSCLCNSAVPVLCFVSLFPLGLSFLLK